MSLEAARAGELPDEGQGVLQKGPVDALVTRQHGRVDHPRRPRHLG